MKYNIYHAKNPTFGFREKPKFPEEYEKVAVVEADSVADTFRITNHIDSDWTRNPEVIEVLKPNSRSTSVGDIVEDEDGNLMYCAPCGWESVIRSEVNAG